MNIKPWNEIKNRFMGGDILIGNGVSISMSNRFAYNSLYEVAQEKMNGPVKEIFNHFDTKDFEEVLGKLSIARDVMSFMRIPNESVEEHYENIKHCLYNTLLSCHANHSEVCSNLDEFGAFLSDFKVIISLNYDLLAYWAILIFNDERNEGNHYFKDGFDGGKFTYPEDENRYWMLHKDSRGTALVFYPHGNLCLRSLECQDVRKLSKKEMNSKKDFREGLKKLMQKEGCEYKPLFVSEGSSCQKMRRINNNRYLDYVYRNILLRRRESLVIMGSSVSKNDEHIFSQLAKSPDLKYLAVSFNNKGKAPSRWGYIKECFSNLSDENIFMFNFHDAKTWT